MLFFGLSLAPRCLSALRAMSTRFVPLAALALGSFCAPATAQTITTANLGANQVVLNLTSTTTGTGYFTLLAGTSTACGTAAQVKAGQSSSGAAAYRIGSLPLAASVAGSYTVKNLLASTAYTVCFTPDGTIAPGTANVTTNAGAALSPGGWAGVGTAGFSAGSANYESLAFGPDGTPYLAYEDIGNSSKATVMKYTAGAWGLVGTAGFSAGSAVRESLAFAPDGTPYLAYEDNGNSNKATVMKYTAGAWGLVGTAGFSAGSAAYESLAFAPDGTPYLAYEDIGNNNKATVMKYTAGTWGLVGTAGFSAGQAAYDSLAFGPDGTPYVAYQDGNNGKATVMKYTAGTWGLVGTAGFSAGSAAYESLAFGPDGTPYLACEDSGNGNKATVMKYTAGAWGVVGTAGFSNGLAGYESLAFGPDGTPYVAYYDSGSGGKATVMKYNGTSWGLAGTAGFSAGLAYYESLAFGPDGTPYVAYYDGVSSSKATVMKLIVAPSATTGAASSITATTATLNGTVNDDGVATTVNFQYGTTTAYGTTIAATTPAGATLAAGSGSTAASVGLTGLAAATAYHFRVVATGNGLTVYGSDATFTTLPLPTVTGISPTSGPAAGGTSVIVTGTTFTGVSAVSFASTPAASYTVDSTTQITAISPAGASVADVQVLTSAGTSPISAADQFTYVKLAQTITFPQPTTPAQAGTSATLTATASSGLAVTYTITSGPATLSGSTVTYTGAGTVVIAADQAGNTQYAAAPTVSDTVTTNKSTPTQYTSTNDQAVQQSVASTLTIILGYPGSVAPTGAITVSIDGVDNPPGLGTPTCKAKNLHQNCSYPYTSPLAPGQYLLTYTQAADSNYNVSSGTSTLTITAPPTPNLKRAPISTRNQTPLQPAFD